MQDLESPELKIFASNRSKHKVPTCILLRTLNSLVYSAGYCGTVPPSY